MVSFNSGKKQGSLALGLIIAGVVLFNYFGSQDYNQVTGETQHVAISPREEIALGLQAAPSMARSYGGMHTDTALQAQVEAVGHRLLSRSAAGKTEWNFQFHLLADERIVNAFALPGGQVFITHALFRLLTTEGQLAGVIGHEIGHVVARHGAEHIAKQRLTQGLTGAAVVASGDRGAGQLAAMVGEMVNMKYGRGDELEADHLGLRFMAEAGYDPRAMIEVMHILQKASKTRQLEFFSTHPNPENRIARIEQAIQEQFPQGVPDGLTK